MNRNSNKYVMDILIKIFIESWNILLDSSVFVLAGIVLAGILKVSFKSSFIIKHLGKGRFLPVIKVALLGIPLPL